MNIYHIHYVMVIVVYHQRVLHKLNDNVLIVNKQVLLKQHLDKMYDRVINAMFAYINHLIIVCKYF